MKHRLALIGLTSILLIFLLQGIACSINADEKADNGETKSNKVEITQDYSPLTEIVEGRPNIYVVVKSMTSSYWKVVLDGVEQAGLDNKCNIYAAGSNLETEWELQEAYVELAMERNADGIILGPDNSVKLSAVVDKVHEADIPIIIVDTIVNTENYDVCYMTDNLLAGESAAKEMIRMLGAKGKTKQDNVKVAIQLGAKASQTINERLAGFCQYWTKYAPDNWEMIDEIICNDGDENLAREISDEFFEKYPDVDGVFGTDNASTMGFSSAIEKLKNSEVVLVGFDYSPEVAALIESNNYSASAVVQNQYDMGYRGVESILGIMWGERGRLKFINTGIKIVN